MEFFCEHIGENWRQRTAFVCVCVNQGGHKESPQMDGLC